MTLKSLFFLVDNKNVDKMGVYLCTFQAFLVKIIIFFLKLHTSFLGKQVAFLVYFCPGSDGHHQISLLFVVMTLKSFVILYTCLNVLSPAA